MSYGAPAQWIEVRYGRQGRRPRNAVDQAGFGDRLWTGSRGMARASPVWRYGGPVSHTMSNPPVPPLGFSAPARSTRPLLVDGPLRKSYADVVRQAAPRQLRGRGFPPRSDVGPDTRHRAFNSAVPQQDVLDHAEALVMSCMEAGETPVEGERDSDTVRGKPAVQDGRLRGAVLAESQAHFLQDIVELSSEADLSAVHRVAPAQRTQGTVVAPSGLEQH
ncbi:hypothetical protein Q5P01_026479 [Channa striata]|uniref:Uncharacterized protein n=1 Tax=Channa striata TaxID=64152 RepID=A0AA88IMK2_CHASR|nr:hypothetical protein Q5P01_026479 [Channa striata]